jgi:hypothetical protein
LTGRANSTAKDAEEAQRKTQIRTLFPRLEVCSPAGIETGIEH